MPSSLISMWRRNRTLSYVLGTVVFTVFCVLWMLCSVPNTRPIAEPITFGQCVHTGDVIPRRLHQMWKNNTIPPRWRQSQHACRTKNDNYEYFLWTDAEMERFITVHYAWFLPTYHSYPYPIQVRHSPIQVCHSPIQVRHSPTQVCHSPIQVRHSPYRYVTPPHRYVTPHTGTSLPIQVRHSPVQVHHSPIKVRHSPIQVRYYPIQVHHSPYRYVTPPYRYVTPLYRYFTPPYRYITLTPVDVPNGVVCL